MRIPRLPVPLPLAAIIAAATIVSAAVGLSVSAGTAAPAGTMATETAKATPRTAKYGGTPPMWVTHPYLAEAGNGRLAVKGQVYVDPFRRPTATRPVDRHLRAASDRVVFSVVVAQPKYANARKPVSVRLLPDSALLARRSQTVIPTARQLVDVNVVLDQATSKRLRAMNFQRQRAATSIVIAHLKDTDEARNASGVWGLTQTNDASLQPQVASSTEQQTYLAMAKRQIRADRGISRKGGAVAGELSKGTQDSPMYNYVYVTNQTPFEQQVAFNPNIQCMWTGASAQYPGAQTAVVPSNGILQMAYVLEPNPYGGKNGMAWAGLNGATTGMNAPGTGVSDVTALVNAATAAGESLFERLGSHPPHGTIGAIAAIGATSATFMKTLIADAVSGTCSTNVSEFPETFGVTTTVTGFGTNSQATAWGTSDKPTTYTPPSNWNTIQPPPPPPSGPYEDVAGTAAPVPNVLSTCSRYKQQCFFPFPINVGTQLASTTPTTCPAPTAKKTPSSWCAFVYNNLQPMLGAQTTATYYWNGGAPSYMVSNNASSGTNTGGSASFTGGLFQSVGPNPGQPGDAWCWGPNLMGVLNCSYMNVAEEATQIQNYNPMGAMNIALTYLSSPQYESGLYTGLAAGQSGTPAPNVIVSPGQNASGESGLNVTCDLSGIQPFLSLPFSAGGGTATTNGPALLSTSVNAAGTKPTGSWNVTFYGLDQDGNTVYYNPSVGVNPLGTGNWSPISSSAFTLGPNLTTTTTSTFDIAQNAMPSGFLPYADFGNLQTAWDINHGTQVVAKLAGIGCTASPALTIPGLDITGTVPGVSNVFGQILPITSWGQQPSGWPMPGGGATSWPSTLYTVQPYTYWTQYAWQTPVNQVNVAFQGTPVADTTALTCTRATSTAEASCTIPKSG